MWGRHPNWHGSKSGISQSMALVVHLMIINFFSKCPSTSTGKSKNVPAPPPRASSHTVSRESSLKYSQTLQRDPRGAKRDISLQYQTLPLPSTKPKQRSATDSATPSPLSFSSGSPTSVKYEGLQRRNNLINVIAKYSYKRESQNWSCLIELLD